MKEKIKYDPTLFSVILHHLNATTREMTSTLEHSARGSIISLIRDFSCSLYTAETDMLFLEEALPVHTLACRENIKTCTQWYKEAGEEIKDGDYILNNDPYLGNTHKGDHSIFTPVFYKGELMFWSMVMAHVSDTGSAQGGDSPNASTIWEDGVTFPGIKIFENEKENKPNIHMYLSNLRYPESQKGDLYAISGAVRIGKRRLLSLCDEYGPELVRYYTRAIIDYADKRTSEEISKWPDGTYYGESWSDSDGQGTWDIKVCCRLTVAGDTTTIDWSESDQQVKGSINSSIGALKANSCNPVFCAIDPSIPHNEGCLRHINIIAPQGLVVNASWPASLAQATYNIGDAVVEAVQKALAHAIPEMVTGGWGRQPSDSYWGYDRRGKHPIPYDAAHYYGSAGGGATEGNDGWPAIHAACSLGAMKTEAIEIHEINYPGIIEKHEVLTDCEGYGQWKGGPAMDFRMRLLKGHTGACDSTGGGFENPCAGVNGGHTGSGGCRGFENLETGKRTFYRGMGKIKMDDKQIAFYIAPSGGGWGSPLDRDIEKVRDDARDEFISVHIAREVYGVVLAPDTYEIDYESSRKLRGELKAKEKKGIVTPNKPGVANYIEKIYKPGDEVIYLEPLPKNHKDWIRGVVQEMKTAGLE
jgi:N-methylhydantoinase B